MVGRLADRLFASPDVYAWEGREADQSVNFVTCHDGFTLNDLVSYNAKHNEANGEGNRDGMDDNRSWNCGVEGPTDDGAVEALRARQVRNLLALTLLSTGVPMIGMGDEGRRTQRGNNNAYSHDDELSWLDWNRVERHRDLRRFVRKLIELRLAFDPSAHIDTISLSDFGTRSPGRRPDLGRGLRPPRRFVRRSAAIGGGAGKRREAGVRKEARRSPPRSGRPMRLAPPGPR